MNQLATQQERIPMDSVGLSTGSTGSKIAPQSLAEVVKFAEVMCRADIALPKHLRGNAGACMAVSLQALDWQMNPFAVASKSYSVNGQIAYEAQLIVAVVNTRSGIEGRIKYTFEGEGPDRVCIATGKLDGEELHVRSPKFKDITPKNSPLWKSDPDQQQCYYTGRSWARRYTPEVILGVYDRDEVESFRGPDNAKDITDRVIIDPLSDEPIAQPQKPQEEHKPSHAEFYSDEPHDALTGEIITENTNTDDTPSSSVDAGEPRTPAETGDYSSSSPVSTSLDAGLRTHLIDFARKASKTVQDEHLTDEAKAKSIDDMMLNYREVIPEQEWGKLSTIKISLQAVLAGKRSIDQARKFIATGLLDCRPDEIGGAA